MNPSIVPDWEHKSQVYQRGITIESQLEECVPVFLESVSKGNHD